MLSLRLFTQLKRTVPFEHVYYCRACLSGLSSDNSTEVHPSPYGDRSVLPLEFRKEMAEKSDKKLRIIINTTHDKLRDQWRTGNNPEQAWAQHISNREELERYAAAVIHREERYKKREQAERRQTPIEWCYTNLQRYFRGGGKEERRALEHGKVARHSSYLLKSFSTSNTDEAAGTTAAEEIPELETAFDKVPSAEDRSVRLKQDGKKVLETTVFNEEVSGASLKKASDKIVSEGTLETNVNDIVDSEVNSTSKDVPKVDSFRDESNQDDYSGKDFTKNGDFFPAKESLTSAPFAVDSTKDHDLNAISSCESSSRTDDVEKLSTERLKDSVPSSTHSLDGSGKETLQMSDHSSTGEGPQLKVLDVGSCYNPFKVYPDLDVTALDLLPATEDTFQCDFLKLNITEPNESIFKSASCPPGVESLHVDIPDEGTVLAAKGSPSNSSSRTITSLPANSFDAVIFSSLLSYMPCPEQRLLCCKQAYRLLKKEGILVVMELDPQGSRRNGYLFESWYIALSSLGFSRATYQKTAKFHGMLFRKGLYPEAHQLRTERKLEKMNERKHNIITQNVKTEALYRRNQHIKDFDLDKAVTGLWLWHNIADLRQEEVIRGKLNKKRKSGKMSANLHKPKVDSSMQSKFTWYLRSYMYKIKNWITKNYGTKNNS